MEQPFTDQLLDWIDPDNLHRNHLSLNRNAIDCLEQNPEKIGGIICLKNTLGMSSSK